MANPEHVEILKQGVGAWNEWRKQCPYIQPHLNDTDLSGLDLSGAHFRYTLLGRVNLHHTNLSYADLIGAVLNGSNLSYANLSHAKLTANLSYVNLSYANLNYADLSYANLRHPILSNADFSNSHWQGTNLVDVDLSDAIGLETVNHLAPSTIGIDTLYCSAGKIPETFLRGCGVPDDFITFIPSHFGIQQAIQFYSCFISYSSKDEEFARRLYSRMRDEHLRVWFAPEDIKGGQKLHEQIERAIQIHDRLLLILSENSMQSEWVMTEIRRARKTGIEEDHRKLFPITLVDYEKIKTWKCFDADTGKDLAVEVREYYIPDFSNWKDHDAFEAAFSRLLRDLKAEEK